MISFRIVLVAPIVLVVLITIISAVVFVAKDRGSVRPLFRPFVPIERRLAPCFPALVVLNGRPVSEPIRFVLDPIRDTILRLEDTHVAAKHFSYWKSVGLPRLRRDWGHIRRICNVRAGNRLTPATSAPGPGPPCRHLHRG